MCCIPAGSSSGAIKMWGYGSPAFTDSAAPRLLRQLKKVDPRSGVGGNPHSKVVGLAVSAGGQVLWSVGKATVSLWSTHSECHAPDAVTFKYWHMLLTWMPSASSAVQ